MTKLALYHNRINRIEPHAFDGIKRYVECWTSTNVLLHRAIFRSLFLIMYYLCPARYLTTTNFAAFCFIVNLKDFCDSGQHHDRQRLWLLFFFIETKSRRSWIGMRLIVNLIRSYLPLTIQQLCFFAFWLGFLLFCGFQMAWGAENLQRDQVRSEQLSRKLQV